MLNNPLNPAGRDTLQIRFDNSIHQCLLHTGVAPEDLRLKRKLTKLWFLERGAPIPGLQRAFLVTVPVSLPRIGAFVLGSSCLLAGFMPQHLVQEPRDDIQHAGLIIGKIIFYEC